MTKAQMIQANALFLLGSPTMPSVQDLVASVNQTGLKLVMLQYSLWSGEYGRSLVPALEARGCTIWYHLLPPHWSPLDKHWINQIALRLLNAKAKAIYCDGNERFGGNKPGVSWDDETFRYYRKIARQVVGDDGMLGGSCWMREPEALDVQGTWEPHERQTPRGMVEDYIRNGEALRQQYPGKRVEIGWIGTPCCDGSGWRVTWRSDDYEYIWRRAREAGLPLTYHTHAHELAAVAGIIGACQRLVEVLA